MDKTESGNTPMINRKTMEATEMDELRAKEGDSFNGKFVIKYLQSLSHHQNKINNLSLLKKSYF